MFYDQATTTKSGSVPANDIEAGGRPHVSPDPNVVSSHDLSNETLPIQNLEDKQVTPSSLEENDEFRYENLTFAIEVPAYATTALDSSAPQPPNLRHCDNPLDWSSSRKSIILFLSCAATFCAAYSAGSYSIAAGPLRAKWHLSNVAFETGVTVWALGFATSPMFLAPLSEINGRRPVFLGSGVIFLAALIGCALTDHFAGMLVARFFVGAGASTFATMVGGVISDVYHAEHRNTPMALYSGCALAGTGMGPMISGFIVEHASWRWVFYHQIISLSITMAAMFLAFKETRGSVLLSRRAKALNRYFEELEQTGHLPQPTSDQDSPSEKLYTTRPTKPLRYTVAADANRASITTLVYLSLTTPFRLLVTEPVVFFFSLWVAFAWALLYMTFGVIPLIFTSVYNFSTQSVGAVFSAIAIGSIVGAALSIVQERIATRFLPKLHSRPEGRLYFACLESALLPIGLFWFGWTSNTSTHWISPILALGCAQIGIFSIYLAVFNYLADVYHRYASSALAGQSFCRNVLAAVFPLFTNQMFERLGYGGASSLLGGIATLLTVVPWVLVFQGERIRGRSKVARGGAE